MNETSNLIQKQRAVYYNRVSTDDEDQLTSLVNQKQDSERTIAENDWVLVDHYIDEAKSGTTTKRRNEYNRMCRDMETDKFDIIVIKDQSRLMRNTREWYIFIDKLVQNKKKLYFYLERKFYSPDDALITGIRAILAEDYSRSLSKNITNAHRSRQKNGGLIILNSRTYGYDNLGKNNIIINEKEAEMIRRMFYLARDNDYGARTISKILYAEGYRNRQGKMIDVASIVHILRNRLYTGDMVMNNLQMDFETKKRVRTPKSEWIIRENAVPAIIDKETWEIVNKKLDDRSIEYDLENRMHKRGKKKNVYPLSGKIICGTCGNKYYRISRTEHAGVQYFYWGCSEYIANGRRKNREQPATHFKYDSPNIGCDSIHLSEIKMMDALYTIAQRIYNKPNDQLVDEVMRIISLAINKESDITEKEERLKTELTKTKNNREVLLDKYLEGLIADDIYRTREEKLVETIGEIEEQLIQINLMKNSIDNQQERLDKIRSEVKNIADKDLTTKNILDHVKEIVVFGDHLEVKFDVFEDVIIDVKRKGNTKNLIVR